MKKQIYLKLGLVSLAALMLILSVNCKNPFKNDSAEDIDVIMSVASQSITDINSFPTLVGMHAVEQSMAGCPADSKHVNVNKSGAPFISNSSPGHGWYSGYFDYNMYTNCNMRLSLFSKFDCVLGATIANTHDTLGGSLAIRGTLDINASGVINMSFNENGIFEVNGRSHNVFIQLLGSFNNTGHGSVTISGSVDGSPVFEVINF